MKQMKKGFMILLFAMMITSTVGSITSIFASVNYNKREQIAKKNLEKKVRTMLEMHVPVTVNNCKHLFETIDKPSYA